MRTTEAVKKPKSSRSHSKENNKATTAIKSQKHKINKTQIDLSSQI